MTTLYDDVGGHAGLRRLAAAWHARAIADPVVGHAFSHGFHPDHLARLAAYWGEALGGPASYSAAYGGESDVVRMHSGNGQHDEMNRDAIACFDAALADVGLDPGHGAGRALHDYFAWATLTTLTRYPDSADDVPDQLVIPKWSRDGPLPQNG